MPRNLQITMRTACIFLALVAAGYAPDPHHAPPDPHQPDHPPPDHPPPDHPHPDGADCHGPDCDLINHALNDISMYFDRHICEVFHGVDCSNHILQYDEKICASDGKTYDNHCLYAKARCEIVLDPKKYENGMLNNPLKVLYCIPATTITVSSGIQTTSGSLAVTSGSGTTSTSASTTNSVQHILGGVFCQHRMSINCIIDLNMVCASNGMFYPNICELLKVQCDNPTLQQVADLSFCSLSP